ncbi:MAG: phosphoribosylglycinamide formyltransferase [Bryobacteraceae bacterium]
MSKPYRVGFCVSGGGRLFRNAVREAERLGIEAAALFVAAKDEPAYRSYCDQHRVPLWAIQAAGRREFGEELTSRSADAALDLIVLTFDRIIPGPMVERYRGRIINMHPGLLPSFRGPHPIEDALRAGVRFIGATMHEVDELVDHGPIIAQCVLPIGRDEEMNSICTRLYHLVRPMFLQTIAWFAAGRIEKDPGGRIWVRGAHYGAWPISPRIEIGFPSENT